MEKNSIQKDKLTPLIVITVGVFAVSTGSIFIRFAQREVPSLVIAAFRLSIATLILAPIAIYKKREEIRRLSGRQIGTMILSGIFLALHFACWISSFEYTSVISSVVLVSTTPLWVAIASPLFLKEKVFPIVWAGLLVTLVGGVIVGLGDYFILQNGQLQFIQSSNSLGKSEIWGNFLALCGAWGGAGYLLIGRGVRQNISILSYTSIVYGSAAVILLGAIGIRGLPLTGYSSGSYLTLLGLALIPQILGHSSFNWALGYLSAAFVSVTMLGEPIGATVLAYLLLNEIPSSMEIIGGGVILSGIFLATRGEQK